MLSESPCPFSRNRNEPEHKGFNPAGVFQSELLDASIFHKKPVEVSDKCGEYHENGILRHEGLGQAVPTEAIAQVVEDALRASSLVVELHNLPCARPAVIW